MEAGSLGQELQSTRDQRGYGFGFSSEGIKIDFTWLHCRTQLRTVLPSPASRGEKFLNGAKCFDKVICTVKIFGLLVREPEKQQQVYREVWQQKSSFFKNKKAWYYRKL